MSERSVYLEGRNLALSCLVVFLAGAGAVVAVGPASSHIESIRLALVIAADGLNETRAQGAEFAPVLSDERSRIGAKRRALDMRLRPADGDAELMALVAEGIHTDGARGFSVGRKTGPVSMNVEDELEYGAEAGDEVAAGAFEIEPMTYGPALAMRPEAVQATMTTSYEAARSVIERLESHTLPARLDALEMKREYPDVSMHLELVYFVRAETER